MQWISPLPQTNIFQSTEFRERFNELVEVVNEMQARSRKSLPPDNAPRPRDERGIPVKLTARGSDGLWEFTEQIWSQGGDEWEDKENPLTHEELGLAAVQGGNGGQPLHMAKVGDRVYLHARQRTDATEGMRYEFMPLYRESFWAKITGNESIGSNQWKYSWIEQDRTSDGWTDTPDGRTGSTETDFALNSIEANNDDSGVEGNSIDVDGTIFDDNDDLEMQPVQGEPVVRIWVETVSGGSVVYTFEYVNAIDGECA